MDRLRPLTASEIMASHLPLQAFADRLANTLTNPLLEVLLSHTSPPAALAEPFQWADELDC